MDKKDISIIVAKYKKTAYGIQLDSYSGHISERALSLIMEALQIAASKSDNYYQIAKFVRLCENLQEQRNESLEYASNGEWGEEIK